MAENPLNWFRLWEANTAMVPRGIHAVQPVSSPKYTLNTSGRGDNFTDSLARMYVQTDNDNDRNQLIAAVQAMSETGDETSAALTKAITSNFGYVDFLLQRITHAHQEKVDVIETVSDSFVSYFFGQAAPQYQYAGVVINSKEDDQAVNLFRLYRDLIRGSELAKRKKRVTLAYDSYMVSGALTNLQEDFTAENEMVVGFSFGLLVQSVYTRQNKRSGIVQREGNLNYLLEGLTPVSSITDLPSSIRLVAVPSAGSSADGGPSTASVPETQPEQLPDRLVQRTGLGGLIKLNQWVDPATDVIYGDQQRTKVIYDPKGGG